MVHYFIPLDKNFFRFANFIGFLFEFLNNLSHINFIVILKLYSVLKSKKSFNSVFNQKFSCLDDFNSNYLL